MIQTRRKTSGSAHKERSTYAKSKTNEDRTTKKGDQDTLPTVVNQDGNRPAWTNQGFIFGWAPSIIPSRFRTICALPCRLARGHLAKMWELCAVFGRPIKKRSNLVAYLVWNIMKIPLMLPPTIRAIHLRSIEFSVPNPRKLMSSITPPYRLFKMCCKDTMRPYLLMDRQEQVESETF